MLYSIVHRVPALKDRALAIVNPAFIATVARQLGLTWRNTPLALPNCIALFARQILGGNLSMPELARLGGSHFTPEAYCIARGKLSIGLLRQLLERLCALACEAQPLWKGHRLWHMDGTGVSMPDTPALHKRFGQSGRQKPGCGFPSAHLLCLFDAATGLVRQMVISPLRTHDMADAAKLHGFVSPGDILIADRAFESFAHLAMLLWAGVHAILPVHQRRQIDFRSKHRRRSRGKPASKRSGRKPPLGRKRSLGRKPPLYDRQVLRRCGSRDQIVRWLKPRSRPHWMEQEAFDALPPAIEVRELRRRVTMPDGRKVQITLITTLLDEALYPAGELIAVLQARWGVEVNLRHLKATMNMNVLRSQTVAGVERELWMHAIVYNAVRLVMLEAAARQRVTPDRISFADALYWVRHGDLSQPLPELLLIPYRPGRIEPRLKKRRRDRFGLLTRPRNTMRKASHRRRCRYKI
jgi:hypothetical protein